MVTYITQYVSNWNCTTLTIATNGGGGTRRVDLRCSSLWQSLEDLKNGGVGAALRGIGWWGCS
jgi:hypothetical protein